MLHSTRAGRALAVLVVSFSASGAAYAQAPSQAFTWIGSVQYATGDYIFTQRTWSVYLSNGVAWSGNRLRVTATVPIVMQDAGWVQYGGSGMMLPTGGMANGSNNGTSTTSGSQGSMMGSSMHGGMMTPSANMPFSNVGIGDPVGRVEVALWSSDRSTSRVSAVVSAKAPVADVNHGFSTGQWDAGGGLSANTGVGGVTFFGDAMYWSLGNPSGASLRNVVAYSVAAGRLFSGPWSMLVGVTGATSYWPGISAPAQAGVGLGYLLESGSGINALATVGLTETAPSLSVGLGWRVPLGKKP